MGLRSKVTRPPEDFKVSLSYWLELIVELLLMLFYSHIFRDKFFNTFFFSSNALDCLVFFPTVIYQTSPSFSTISPSHFPVPLQFPCACPHPYPGGGGEWCCFAMGDGGDSGQPSFSLYGRKREEVVISGGLQDDGFIGASVGDARRSISLLKSNEVVVLMGWRAGEARGPF